MFRIDEGTWRWWTLAGTCAGLFLLMLDSTIVALALPEIKQDVGASPTGLQWVMNGYLLVLAVLVITAGRLGAAGIAALVVFWIVEHRVRNPIVDFPLFRNGPYFGASAAAFTLVGAYWTVMFVQPQFLQTCRDDRR